MAAALTDREMYKVKPIYADTINVGVPDVMYKVKSLHEESGTTEMVAGQSDPLSALEQRQESILSRLSNIKQMLDKLTDKYQPASVPKSHTTPGSASSSAPSSSSSMVPGLELMSATSSIPVAASSSLAGKPLQDIVISADPASPPLSLFALYEILRSQLPTLATTYVHSSVSDVKPSLRSVLNNGSQVNRGNHAIALSIIWKKVETGPFLMVSPSNQCQIQGEVNIARYLNRIINPTFDTDDITMATQVDDWLDTAGQQLLNGNSKERAAAMRSLNSRLGRNDWLVGSAFSLADIVSWSAVMQSQQAEGASANVKKWLKACAANPILQSAASVL